MSKPLTIAPQGTNAANSDH